MEIYPRLLAYLKPYRMRMLWAACFMLLTSGMIAVQTYLIKPILDKVIIGNNIELGMLLPPALIIVSILKGITSYASNYFMGYIGQKVVNDIRDHLYAHVQTLSFSYFNKTPTGVIICRAISRDSTLFDFPWRDS